MSAIKRFDMGYTRLAYTDSWIIQPEESTLGDWVRHKDHAAEIAKLVEEIKRLTAERDRYKEWHDAVMAEEPVAVCTVNDGDLLMIVRPKPLEKE